MTLFFLKTVNQSINSKHKHNNRNIFLAEHCKNKKD